MGEGYERLVKGDKEENDGEFHALAADYEMASYFRQMEPLAFAGGLGGRTARQDDETPARRLLDRHRGSKLQFPIHAGAHHGVKRYAKACLYLISVPSSRCSASWRMLLDKRDLGFGPVRIAANCLSLVCSGRSKQAQAFVCQATELSPVHSLLLSSSVKLRVLKEEGGVGIVPHLADSSEANAGSLPGPQGAQAL